MYPSPTSSTTTMVSTVLTIPLPLLILLHVPFSLPHEGARWASEAELPPRASGSSSHALCGPFGGGAAEPVMTARDVVGLMTPVVVVVVRDLLWLLLASVPPTCGRFELTAPLLPPPLPPRTILAMSDALDSSMCSLTMYATGANWTYLRRAPRTLADKDWQPTLEGSGSC